MGFPGAVRGVLAWVLLISSGSTLAAETPSPLPATSPWLLRYDADRCRAVREFGAGENLVTLWLDQSGLEPSYTLTIIGGPARRGFGPSVEIRFGAEGSTKRSYVRGETQAGAATVTLYGVPLAPRIDEAGSDIEPIGPAREAAIASIALRGGGAPVTLATGSLGEILAAMRTCVADLAAELEGPDRIAQAAIPVDNPGDWLKDEDYPGVLALKRIEGLVRFRLVVNERGVPTACQILARTQSESFGDVVCLSLLKRARFKPAQDRAGKPVVSYWSSSARFESE